MQRDADRQGLGRLLAAARTFRRMRQRDLDAMCRFPPGRTSPIERGRSTVRYLEIRRIAAALRLPSVVESATLLWRQQGDSEPERARGRDRLAREGVRRARG
jgi:hypothetical protein